MNSFIHFELSKTKANNTNFRTGKPVSTAPDWTGRARDEFCQSLYENPDPKPVMFVRKAIMVHVWSENRNILDSDVTQGITLVIFWWI